VEVKVAEFNYKLVNKIIATKENLYKWQKIPSPNCIHCNTTLQTDKHLLWDCPNTFALWQSLAGVLHVNITWQSIVMGSKIFGLCNQIVSLISYLIYKKHIEENNCDALMHRNLISYVKEQLTLRNIIYRYCPTKANIVTEVENIVSSL
jgi:hypothetical protein